MRGDKHAENDRANARQGVRFRDPEQQRQFDEQGYVVCRLMEEAEAEALAATIRDQYGEQLSGDYPGCYHSNIYSNSDPDVAVRDRFDAMVQQALRPGIERLFLDWKMIDACSIVKVPGGRDTPLHQDYPTVDSPFGDSMLTWVSLGHATRENGCLRLVPGSQRLYRHVRAIGSHDAFGPHGAALAEEYGVDLEIGPGVAVITDLSIWHQALPNRSDEPRFAVMSNIASPSVQPAKFIATPDGGAVAVTDVDWDALYNFLNRSAPISWSEEQVVRRLPPWSKSASYAQLEALLLARGPRATLDYDPLDTVAHLADAPATAAPPPEPRWRRALRRVPGSVGAVRAVRGLARGKRQ